MKINIKDAVKLTTAIVGAEGPRCTARTVSATDVAETAANIERRLLTLLPKKDWAGLRFVCDPHAQSFPGAYKGTPMSTGFTLERTSSGWFVTSVCRGVCHGPTSRIVPINLKERAAAIAAFVATSF